MGDNPANYSDSWDLVEQSIQCTAKLELILVQLLTNSFGQNVQAQKIFQFGYEVVWANHSGKITKWISAN